MICQKREREDNRKRKRKEAGVPAGRKRSINGRGRRSRFFLLSLLLLLTCPFGTLEGVYGAFEGEVLEGEVLEGEVLEGEVLEGEVLEGEVLEGEVFKAEILEEALGQEAAEDEQIAPDLWEEEVDEVTMNPLPLRELEERLLAELDGNLAAAPEFSSCGTPDCDIQVSCEASSFSSESPSLDSPEFLSDPISLPDLGGGESFLDFTSSQVWDLGDSSLETKKLEGEEEECEEIPGTTPVPSYDFTPALLNTLCQVEEDSRQVTLKVKEGQDVTDPLNYALAYVKTRGKKGAPWTLVVPPGSYQLSGTLFMYSFTHLKATGATLTKVSPTKHILLRLGSSLDQGKGFETYQDVVIEGGTWDCNYESLSDEKKKAYGGTVGFRLGHATDVVIRDCTIKNTVQGHLIELAGVRRVEICGCTLTGYWKGHKKRNQEAIQLDVVLSSAFPGYLPYDGLACEEVNIHDNRIVDNLSGIGFHNMVPEHPYKGIFIHDNYFSDITRRAISVANLENGEIYGNVFERVYIGIQVSSITGAIHFLSSKNSMAPHDFSCDLSIHDNRMSLYGKGEVTDESRTSYGISLMGDVFSSDDMIVNGLVREGVYGLKGVKVNGNEIRGGEACLRLRLCRECEVANNQFFNSLEPGIYVNGSVDCRLLSNLIQSSGSYGIYLNKAAGSSWVSQGNLLQGNTLEGSGKFGVYLKGAYPDNRLISNRILLSKEAGIYCYKVKGGDLTGNLIQGNLGKGICLSGCSKLNLEGNQVKANKGDGLVITGCSIRSLNKNEVGHNEGYGFYVKDTQIKTMKENRITGNAICQKNSTGIKAYKLSCSTKDSGGKTIIKGKAKGLKKVTVLQGDVFLCEGKVSNNKYSIKTEKLGEGQLLIILGEDSKGNLLRMEAVTG